MEKEVISLIDNNIERYLKANPHADLGNYSYGDKLTDDLFYNILYYSDKRAEKLEKDLDEWFMKGNNVAIILGYMGCGKTTFVNHYLWRKKRINDKVIVFDLEKKNVKTKTDIFINKLGLELYSLLKEQDNSFRKEFYKLYDDNYDFFDNCEPDDTLQEFVVCYCAETNLNKREQGTQIKKALLNLRIESMFSVLFLYLIALQVIDGKGVDYLLCFDNLDVAYEGKSLQLFYEGFLNAITNWERGLPNLEYPIDVIGKRDLYNNMNFIFSMRETSKSKVTAYFRKEITGFVKPFNLTEVYDKAAVIRKRVALLKRYKEFVDTNVLRKCELIDKILNDSYIKANIFALFNHDYRSCINNIVMICDDSTSEELIQDFLDLNSIYMNDFEKQYSRYGARGILFRLIFNVFKVEGYYEKISIYSFDNVTHKEQFSIPRMILTFVSNVQTNDGKIAVSIGGTNTPVALNRIFEAFRGIIDADVIVNCIINMYELRNTSWNHLITFDTLKGNDVDDIREELQNYNSGKKNSEYSTVLITCGGNAYLSTMATHFEFFASRIWGSSYAPLFAKRNLIRDKKGKFVFQIIIEKVHSAVKSCCNRIRTFDTEKFLSKYEENIYVNYADSDYVYKDRKEKDGQIKIIKQFHGEKIIHTHISYLDAYRLYLLNTDTVEEKDKPLINQIIVDFIKDYIDIIDTKKVIFSDSTLLMVEKYQKAIVKIEGSNYADMRTAISVEEGRNITQKSN